MSRNVRKKTDGSLRAEAGRLEYRLWGNRFGDAGDLERLERVRKEQKRRQMKKIKNKRKK